MSPHKIDASLTGKSAEKYQRRVNILREKLTEVADENEILKK